MAAMIGIDDDASLDQIDVATLPKFIGTSPCPSCRLVLGGGWVMYCPGCPKIHGSHFHLECRCGAKWDER